MDKNDLLGAREGRKGGVNGRMMKPPPVLDAAARICSMVAGIFHVSANLRLFSRKDRILESIAAMLAVFFFSFFFRGIL